MKKLAPSKFAFNIVLILGKISIRPLILLEDQIQLVLGKGSGGDRRFKKLSF
jgi:hypothetical protein